MSQFPPPVPPPAVTYAPPQPGGRPANAWAIVSLITGIIGCAIITAIVAVVTGIIGLGKARVQGGRGMAIAGIILGLIWLLVGLAAVGGGFALWKNASGLLAETAKPQTIALINRVAGGDMSRDTSTGTLTDADLAAVAAIASPLGDCQNISITSSSINVVNDRAEITFDGTATFERGSTPIHAKMHTTGGGTPQTGPPAVWEFDRLELK
ncbi:MAG TPA: DUF4190 domain-containing protein [Tepidisphaeraceae bacterium]|jgi:hypothetical protein